MCVHLCGQLIMPCSNPTEEVHVDLVHSWHCVPGLVMWVHPARTNTPLAHALCELAGGDVLSWTLFFESRFAQAVCTGVAPDYSRSRCAESGTKYRTFYRKKEEKKKRTDERSKLSQGKRANIRELSVKRKRLSQHSEAIDWRKRWALLEGGREHTEVCSGSFFDLSFWSRPICDKWIFTWTWSQSPLPCDILLNLSALSRPDPSSGLWVSFRPHCRSCWTVNNPAK